MRSLSFRGDSKDRGTVSQQVRGSWKIMDSREINHRHIKVKPVYNIWDQTSYWPRVKCGYSQISSAMVMFPHNWKILKKVLLEKHPINQSSGRWTFPWTRLLYIQNVINLLLVPMGHLLNIMEILWRRLKAKAPVLYSKTFKICNQFVTGTQMHLVFPMGLLLNIMETFVEY